LMKVSDQLHAPDPLPVG